MIYVINIWYIRLFEIKSEIKISWKYLLTLEYSNRHNLNDNCSKQKVSVNFDKNIRIFHPVVKMKSLKSDSIIVSVKIIK